MKLTNEQQESIILKEIATSINAMSSPKFKHLNEMLNHFGYHLHSCHENNDISMESQPQKDIIIDELFRSYSFY